MKQTFITGGMGFLFILTWVFGLAGWIFHSIMH